MRVAPFSPLLALVFALAADGERSVLKGNLDVFLPHAGQLDDGDDVVVVLIKIERGSPSAEQLRLATEIAQKGNSSRAYQIVPQIGPAIKRWPSRDLGFDNELSS